MGQAESGSLHGEMYGALTKTPFFLHLTEKQLHQLTERFEHEVFQPGEFLCRMGEPASRFFVIGSGIVVLSLDRGGKAVVVEDDIKELAEEVKEGLGSKEIVDQLVRATIDEGNDGPRGSLNGGRRNSTVLATKKSGAIVGQEDIMEENAVRSHSVLAATRVKCVWLSRKELFAFLSDKPDLRPGVLAALGDKVEEQLARTPLFKGVPIERLRLVASAVDQRSLDAGEILFHEGDEKGDSMYIVYEGSVKAVTHKEEDGKRQEIVLNVFRKGQFFGEIGLLLSVPRTATMVGEEKSLLLQLRRHDFQQVMNLANVPALESNINEIMKRRATESFRKYSIPFFAAIPDDKYYLLAKLSEIREYPPHTVLFSEGDIGDKFYLIVFGGVKVTIAKEKRAGDSASREELELVRLGPGNYFGESALLEGTRRNATVTTVTRCVMVSLDRESSRKFFEQVPEALADFEIRLSKYNLKFKAVLHHPLGLRYFTKHLEREYATENIKFWVEARNFAFRFAPLAESDDEKVASLDRSNSIEEADDLMRQENEAREKAKLTRVSTPAQTSDLESSRRFGSDLSIVSLLSNQSNLSDEPPTRESMEVEARRIVDTYLSESAPMQVNVKGNTRSETVEQASKKVTPNMFEKAQYEIEKLMETDSYSRFKQSDLFQEFLDATAAAAQEAIMRTTKRNSSTKPSK